MEILNVENLSKYYGEKENKIKALDRVSFKAKLGEFISIIGPSGSGKSTLLHLLGTLDIPSDGTVYIEGEDVYKCSEEKRSILRRRKIGFVFQFFNLVPILDVEENISLPVLIDENKVDINYLNEIITFLGLDDRRKHIPSELSGGQQQRVAIGRAIINKPSIILADEPTGNLDTKNSKDVMELLRLSAKKFNQTLIVITHDIEIANMADRVIKMQDGKIISDKYLKEGNEF
ncbi:ABC transporter ATP-binding protein [Clostridium sp.]|uniref:ABC transporter ATP-binding protein n=1 Tax=Clostridium sp. TaxID=1506 RepID=UPI002FC61336